MKKITLLLIMLMASGLAFAQPGSFVDLGVIGPAGTYVFNTDNSLNILPSAGNTDTEMGLWDAAGTLLDADDDGSALNFWSEISATLADGIYYIGISEFNSVFASGFLNTGSGFETGETADLVLNIDTVFAGTFVGASDALDQETAFFRVTIGPPGPGSFIDLGVIGPAGTYVFNTDNSLNISPIAGNTDTELGLWDATGTLLDSDDDGSALNFWSEISATLADGEYFLGISEFNSVFAAGYLNTGSAFEPGEIADLALNIDTVLAGTFAGASDALGQETGFFKVTILSASTTDCGAGLPAAIDSSAAPVVSLATTTVAPGVIGAAPGEYTIDGVSFDAQANWANEVVLTLTSPGGGASIDLNSSNGPSSFANMITEFRDDSTNDVTTWSAGDMLPDYQAEGGLLNTIFAGQPADGVWDLTVTDTFCCDGGTWNEWCITLSLNPVVPIIICPGDIMAFNTAGQCDAVVNFTDAIAFDPDGGPVTVMQTMGLPSGSVFPLGVSTIEFTATDQDGDTSTCTFTITVIDNEPPTSFTCPADQTVDNDPGICGALVMYDNPIVVDNCFTNDTGGGGTYDMTINIAEPALMSTNTFSFTGASIGATADATLTVTSLGDLDGTGGNEEAWTIFDEDANTTGMIGASGTFADQCNTTFVEVFTIPAAMIDTWAADGMIDFEGTDVAGNINIGGLCTTPPSFLELQLTYDFGGPPGPIPFTVIAGQASGTVFPVGTTTNTLEYTDAGGNTIQCSFDVTVLDVEAPVIICQGEPAPTTGSTSASPALAIPDNDPAGISTTLTVTDDFAITDLNVDLNISHTWVGDLIVTLESPSGMMVTVIDQPGVPATGFGCDGDDIIATMDDEAAAPVEDECGAGVPTISGSFIPNNALSAFDGEMTAGDWILTVSDNAAGDLGTINSFGITYEHIIPGIGIDVILDANGMATIPASDMIFSATDNCGAITVTAAGGAPLPMTLPTTLAGGNGNFGNMFDVNALNALTIDSFDIHGDTGAVYDVEVWAKSGTWVGAEGDMSQWTLIGTAPGVVSNGDGVATPLGLALGYAIPAGETHAFYVTPTDFSTGGFNYTNGTATGDVFASDANLEFLEGAGVGYPFDGGTVFQPRVWNGNIHYSAGGAVTTMIDFTCDDVGVNLIQVFVTDAAGNESTCTATVTVIDNIAPILVCMDATIEIGPDGEADVDPFAFVDLANTVEACGIDVIAIDVPEVFCSDIGTPIVVTIFVADPSGNIAACTAIMTVVDLLGPEVTCPADQTVDPGSGNLFYPLPDYFALGEASATDNCTDPVTIFSQNPPVGTLLGDGVYTIECIAEDEYGNIGLCTFELTVESVLGTNDNAFSNAIVMYPNPANEQVIISNSSNIELERVLMFDVVGKLVNEVDMRGTQGEKVIDISTLQSGVYMVQIQGENASVTKRLIKE